MRRLVIAVVISMVGCSEDPAVARLKPGQIVVVRDTSASFEQPDGRPFTNGTDGQKFGAILERDEAEVIGDDETEDTNGHRNVQIVVTKTRFDDGLVGTRCRVKRNRIKLADPPKG